MLKNYSHIYWQNEQTTKLTRCVNFRSRQSVVHSLRLAMAIGAIRRTSMNILLKSIQQNTTLHCCTCQYLPISRYSGSRNLSLVEWSKMFQIRFPGNVKIVASRRLVILRNVIAAVYKTDFFIISTKLCLVIERQLPKYFHKTDSIRLSYFKI